MTKRRPWWSDSPAQRAGRQLRLPALLLAGFLVFVFAPKPVMAAPAKPGNGLRQLATVAPPVVRGKARPLRPALKRAQPKAPPPSEPLASNPADYLVATLGAAEVLAGDFQGVHGAASFYGHAFQGRRTASGETFDVREFTGASNRFPLGSKVAVYRPDTEACVIVRINDRMAGHRKRVIDLSRSAAEALGSLRAGVAIVRVARLDPAHAAALFAGEGETDARQACRAAFGLPEMPDFYGQPPSEADFSLPVQDLGMQ
ncbi:septal ring lytic transglycosylase RlpA family protein [Dechloromonas sp. ZY10]|uniref:septal ring lytic transglycosylase RlpA family protein n=1 Tax=Dechloromonas aquae TaxID=2664436 RepID=UPI003527026B